MARLQNGTTVQLTVAALYWRLLCGLKIDAIFFHLYSLTRDSMPSQPWVSVLFLILWMRLILEVIGSYKHTVYYVMQIGAITLASML